MGEIVKFKNIKFKTNENQDEKSITAALKILLDCDKFSQVFKESIQCTLSKKGCTCFICCLKNVYNLIETENDVDIESFKKRMRSESEFRIAQAQKLCEPMDILNCILSALHRRLNLKTFGKLDETGCNNPKKCFIHSLFGLKIEETYKCSCPKNYKQEWESMNFCQYFNMADILLKANFSVTKELLNVPNRELLKFKDKTNISLIGDISKNLKEVFNTSLDSCPNELCSKCKIEFNMDNNPDFYLINLVWGSNKVTHLDCYLSTLSINSELKLKEIYGTGSEESFYIKGILFCMNDTYEYAYRYENHWIFKGLSKDCGWYELLQEITIMKYYPVTVIYEKNIKFEGDTLDIYRKLKIEKLACEYDHFGHYYQCLIERKDYSGYFINKKKLIEENNGLEFIMKIKRENLNSFKICSEDSVLINRKQTTKVEKAEITSFIAQQKKNENLGKKSNEGEAIIRDKESKKESSELKTQHMDYSKLNTENDIKVSSQSSKLSKSESISKVAFWTCFCLNSNEESTFVCNSCKQLKPGLDGWACNKCFKRAQYYHEYCRYCTNVRKNELIIFKNDEFCKYCKYPIKSTSFCDQCKISKLDASNPLLKLDQPKIYDSSKYNTSEFVTETNNWPCSKCKTTNLSSCAVCKKCNTQKEKLIINENTLWICRKCNNSNNLNILQCTNCGLPNTENLSEEKKIVESTSKNANYCKKCNSILSNSSECLKCKDLTKNFFSDYWECPMCNKKNLNKRIECAYCTNNLPVKSNSKCIDCNKNTKYIGEKCIACTKKNEEERKGWVCKICNTNYTNNIKICAICTRKNEEERKGWICKTCNANYTNDIKNCAKCTRKNEEERKVWVCKTCNTSYTNDIKNCDACTQEKIQTKKKCEICEIEIFTSNKKCQTCIEIEKISGTYYICENCKVTNKQSKIFCRNCRNARGKATMLVAYNNKIQPKSNQQNVDKSKNLNSCKICGREQTYNQIYKIYECTYCKKKREAGYRFS